MELYTSIADLPLDTWDGEDEDNSVLQHLDHSKPRIVAREEEAKLIQQLPLPRALTSAPTVNYVPFKRTLKKNMVGRDVFAVKRALSVAGFGRWGSWGTAQNFFGAPMKAHLESFQSSVGLKADGVYGPSTHAKLAPHIDQYGVWLIHQIHLISPAEKKRDTIIATAMLAYMNRATIHYTQSSLRMWGVRNHIHPPHVPSYEDCSSISTWYYWVASASDPNGLNYNGQGYTGTLTKHGSAIYLSQAKPGDLVFYGGNYSVPSHVAVYVGNGRVVSHGSEIGPLLLAAAYRPITEVRSYI